jgi:hypothetical protein
MQELLLRQERELKNPPLKDHICRGTLISMTQYRVDVMRWGYKDARN